MIQKPESPNNLTTVNVIRVMSFTFEPLPFPPSLEASRFQGFGREVKGIHPRDILTDPDAFHKMEDALYRVGQ